MELDNWHILKNYTNARIALGRSGNSLPTTKVLDFRMAHALAKDAINTELDILNLVEDAKKIGFNSILVQSQISSRIDYLKNPNIGRLLNETSIQKLKDWPKKTITLSIIIADGLSAEAVNIHAIKLIEQLIPKLKFKTISPIIIVKYGRVAISDEIGEILNSTIALILIGERPGLSSPTSMGAYITYKPQKGNTDEKRNCISNIQSEGLSYELASMKLAYLIDEMLYKKLSGVDLKDDFSDKYINK
jgi:ethanolamine ammonia-lyase small subunit